MRLRRLVLSISAAGAMVAAGAVGVPSASAATAGPEGDPQFTTVGGVAPQFLANAETIQHWTFNYTDPTNHVTYTITMAGSDPRQGGSSQIHTVIIPLKMNFLAANQDLSSLVGQGYPAFVPHIYNHTFDGSSKVAQTLASPEFSPFTYPTALGGDTGQNGDVFMRAQFNKIGSSYHVSLVNDAILPTVTLNVPAEKGIAYERPADQWRHENLGTAIDLTGLAESGWFSSTLQQLMGSLQIDAQTVPIFLTDNVLLYTNANKFKVTYTNCCILGFHGAGMPIGHGAGSANGQGKQPVQTFMYSAYVTPATYSGFLTDYTGTRTAPRPTRGLSDIHALSHEVGEFMDDPFVNNAVRPWKSLTAPQYPCTPVLETGDPVVGVWYGLNGNTDANAYGQWHPEDLVFAQWYGDGGVETPMGSSWDGRFTFMGPENTGISPLYNATFSTYSPTC